MLTRTLCRTPTTPSARSLNPTTNGFGGVRQTHRENIKPRNVPGDVADNCFAPVDAQDVGRIVGVAPRTLLREAIRGEIPSPLPMCDRRAHLGKSCVGFDLAHHNDAGTNVVDFVEDEPPHLGVGVVGACGMAPTTGKRVNYIAIVRVKVDSPVVQGQADVEEEDI
jgi:hypothetical protein